MSPIHRMRLPPPARCRGNRRVPSEELIDSSTRRSPYLGRTLRWPSCQCVAGTAGGTAIAPSSEGGEKPVTNRQTPWSGVAARGGSPCRGPVPALHPEQPSQRRHAFPDHERVRHVTSSQTIPAAPGLPDDAPESQRQQQVWLAQNAHRGSLIPGSFPQKASLKHPVPIRKPLRWTCLLAADAGGYRSW